MNQEIPEHIYVSLKHEFSCFSVFLPSIQYIFHFMSKNYLISCASSFFTYLHTYVCILTLNRQTIPCNVATPSAILKPRVSSVCSYSKVGTTVPLLFWEFRVLGTINGAPLGSQLKNELIRSLLLLISLFNSPLNSLLMG